jgi:hypothetical protein
MKKELRPTDKYKHMNHHHELTDDYEIVNFGDGDFVANKDAIPLLKALNEAGLRTRSHHLQKAEPGFICILLENARVEIREVNEIHINRKLYNGKIELCIMWEPKCRSCNGTGEIEKTIGGFGWPEADVPTVCTDCNGTGNISNSLK